MTDFPLPQHAVVWAEIPVTDMDRAKAFYAAVLGNPLVENNDGPNPMAVLPSADAARSVSGHLYPGKPAKSGEGPTVSLVVPGALEDAIGRVREAGGTVLSDPIAIPVGRFFYAQDLDGNSISFFEFGE